jgi:hypothetical protein
VPVLNVSVSPFEIVKESTAISVAVETDWYIRIVKETAGERMIQVRPPHGLQLRPFDGTAEPNEVMSAENRVSAIPDTLHETSSIWFQALGGRIHGPTEEVAIVVWLADRPQESDRIESAVNNGVVRILRQVESKRNA